MGASYTATVVWNDADPQTHTWSFSTSDVGSEPVDADLVGNTYAYDLTSGTVVAPAGGDALLGQFNATFLQTVTAQTDTEISFLAGIAAADTAPPEQDFCSPSINLNEKQPAVWADPYFQAGPADIPQTLDIPGFGVLDVLFRDVAVSGVFASSDGSAVDLVVEGTFDATVDVRDAGLGDVCDQLGLLVPGLTCITCPHDPSSQQCIIFNLIDLQAELVPGLTLIEWSQKDVDANGDCP